MATSKKSSKPNVKKPAPKAVIKKNVAKPVAKKAAPKAPVKKQVAKAVAKKPMVNKAVKKPVPVKKAAKNAKPNLKKAPVKKAVAPVVKKTSSSTNKTANKKLSKPLNKSSDKKIKLPAKASKPLKKVLATLPSKANVSKKAEPKSTPVKIDSKPLPKAKDIKVPPPKPLMLPKFGTTRARKYEPDFMKSVLDQAPAVHNGPTMRYSDNELTEFRELIQRKLETAKKELGYLQGLITRKDEMGGDETDNRYMTMEDGSLSMEREQLSQMASRQITFIDHLEKAMMRIENKTYGICRVTGKLIDKARLRAVPHATLSIEAKMGISR